MQDEKKKVIAERIASIIQSDGALAGNEQVWKAIAEISARLVAIEHRLAGHQETPATHPSQSQYDVLEAVNDPLGTSTDEKACAFEPNDRPCDHCLMCSSRGF